jgi:cholinesterase
MAVEWVHDNIHAFSGDTSRMILFGQSAGSASVDHYTYSWASDPKVSGFIMESGAAGFGKPLPQDLAQGWYGVSDRLGCGTKVTNRSSDILSCLQKKDVWKLLEAMGSYGFGPSVDNITGFPDYPSRAKAGQFAQLPILNGNNDNEAGLYVPMFALLNRTIDPAYMVDKNNKTFSCPTGARANISASHGLPTWRYRWFGDFPNTRITTNPDSGAYHCSEIPIIWDTLATGKGIPPDTPEEVSIREYVQGAWAAFAKDPWGGLNSYGDGWPQYSPFEPTLIRLGYDNITGTNAVLPDVYDATCLTTYPIDDPHQRSEL